MQEVHSKDGDIVHVLDSADLNEAKDAVIEYLGKLLKWLVGVGIPAAIMLALFAVKLRGDVDKVMADHEMFREHIEQQNRLVQQLDALGAKLDRAHNDLVGDTIR